MKIRYALIVCLLGSAYATGGQAVTLTWTQSGSPNIVANEVYCGPISGGPYRFHYRTKEPATSLTVPKVHSGTYYCMVTAINNLGEESLASGEVEVDVPLGNSDKP